ncbi:hypothetical protein I79_014148 [Cricetulus griseus]|uniref:Uncharacterized protein n=1 Tax=Cricetulus griseus TaxID=10029 RepID=G3HTC6_CRIGR|nr:hypothetical protein I79_014148 [Cricetulus griseus]
MESKFDPQTFPRGMGELGTRNRGKHKQTCGCSNSQLILVYACRTPKKDCVSKK